MVTENVHIVPLITAAEIRLIFEDWLDQRTRADGIDPGVNGKGARKPNCAHIDIIIRSIQTERLIDLTLGKAGAIFELPVAATLSVFRVSIARPPVQHSR